MLSPVIGESLQPALHALLPQPSPLGAALLGYAVIAMLPGPNMLVVASVAALRGHRAALPHCLGTGVGVAVVATYATLLAASLDAGSATDLLLRAGSALLLLRAALRIMRLARRGQPEEGAAHRSRFLAGFQVAALNPLAFSHFVSVAAPGTGSAAGAVPLLALGAGTIALAVGAAVATAFGCGAMQRAIGDAHRPVCLGSAGLLCMMAFQRISTLVTGG